MSYINAWMLQYHYFTYQFVLLLHETICKSLQIHVSFMYLSCQYHKGFQWSHLKLDSEIFKNYTKLCPILFKDFNIVSIKTICSMSSLFWLIIRSDTNAIAPYRYIPSFCQNAIFVITKIVILDKSQQLVSSGSFPSLLPYHTSK